MWGYCKYMNPPPQVIIIFSRKFHNVFTISTEILVNNYLMLISPILKVFYKLGRGNYVLLISKSVHACFKLLPSRPVDSFFNCS